MKFAIVCLLAITTLFSGAASLQCYYCKGRDCSASELQVETCYGSTRNYQGESETIEPENGSSTTAATNVDETTNEVVGDESTAAPAAGDEVSAEPDQETTTTTTAATTTTRKPCKLWPSWNRWSRGVTPMCANGTTKGFFGRTTPFKGCVYKRNGINPCATLRFLGGARSCSTCTGDKCN